MYRLFLLTFFISIESRYNYLFNTGTEFGFASLYREPIKQGCCTEDPSKNLVRDLKPDAEIVRTFCTDLFNAREVYNFVGYEIKYKFKHNIEDLTNVGINNRAIYVIVKLENGIEAKDERILPEGLRTRDAMWRMDGNEIIVTIPYEAGRNVEIPLACPRIKENQMDVPSLSPNYPVYSLNYGVDST